MTSSWPSALASLDASLAMLSESLGKIKAAQSVDIREILEQAQKAAEFAHNLRTLVSSELPAASWTNRAELDALIAEEAQKTSTLTGMLSSEAAPGSEAAHPSL